MRDGDLASLALMIGLLIILIFVVLALTAGDIVTQLLSPIPSVAGPIGAGVALIVFVYLLIKSADVIFG